MVNKKGLLSLLTVSLLFLSSGINSFSKELERNSYETELLPLPGSLNKQLFFNSNSPEVVLEDGILLSTFDKKGKKNSEAHLEQSFSGKFSIFTHHIADERKQEKNRTLFQGIILKNITNKAISLRVIGSATYSSQPDAPFIKLPDMVKNNFGEVFAGPGDRVNQNIIRRKSFLEREINIPANDYYILMNQSIKTTGLKPPINGRSALFELETNGEVEVADLAIFKENGKKPELKEWLTVLKNGKLSERRDKIPTPLFKPNKTGKPFYYGRVAGIANGNKWTAKIVSNGENLDVAKTKKNLSFVLNTVYQNTLDTDQIQSAEMLKRYSDTAYQSHANYGVTYEIEIPFYNSSSESKEVSISFSSPIRIWKTEYPLKISFYKKPPNRINFRGEVKMEYTNYFGIRKEKYTHLVQRFGQEGGKILNFILEPNSKNLVKISYIYPADATPPHILNINLK